MSRAPGVTLEGDGVTHEGGGVTLEGGPPHEQVSRTDMDHILHLVCIEGDIFWHLQGHTHVLSGSAVPFFSGTEINAFFTEN